MCALFLSIYPTVQPLSATLGIEDPEDHSVLGAEDPEITRTWSLAWRTCQFSSPAPSVPQIVSWLRQELCLLVVSTRESPGRLLLLVGKSSPSGARDRIKEKTVPHSAELGEQLQSLR